MTINLFELHVTKSTWGITVLTINGRSLFEIWKGTKAVWVEVLFIRWYESLPNDFIKSQNPFD
jgi:hypothetical protein